MDSSIHRINSLSVDRYERNQLHYPLDRDLSSGWRYPAFEQLGPALHIIKPEILLTIGIWNPRFTDKEYWIQYLPSGIYNKTIPLFSLYLITYSREREKIYIYLYYIFISLDYVFTRSVKID